MIHGEFTVPLVLCCCSLVGAVRLEVASWLCWGCQATDYLGFGVAQMWRGGRVEVLGGGVFVGITGG